MAPNKPHPKVQRKSNKKFSFKKSITKIKLDRANVGKIERMEAVSAEYMRVTQVYCDWLIQSKHATPDKNADLPKIETRLSVRWQRCAWRQACGIVQVLVFK